MSILDFMKFGKQRVEAEAVTPERSGKNAIATQGLRRNMWVVVSDGRTGILTGANAEGIATVMLTQADGTNLAQVNTMLASLRQATRDEIPAGRRPNRDQAAQFGYK